MISQLAFFLVSTKKRISIQSWTDETTIIFAKTISCFCENILIFRANFAMITLNITLIGEIAMSISYDKLWKMLIDKKMNRTELKEAAGISFNVLAKMGKNEFISMESLCRICSTLECDLGDIVELKRLEA